MLLLVFGSDWGARQEDCYQIDLSNFHVSVFLEGGVGCPAFSSRYYSLPGEGSRETHVEMSAAACTSRLCSLGRQT